MPVRKINKKIDNHLEKIKKEDEVVGRFLERLIELEEMKGENWHYNKKYRKIIKKATEEYIDNDAP